MNIKKDREGLENNMNLEIEIKAKIRDFSKIRKQLLEVGAKKTGTVHQIDTYYLISPKYRFKSGEPRLRIRENKTANKFFWEYHQPTDMFGAKEYETEIDDPKMAKLILKKLGYEAEAVIDKVREEYKFKSLNIVLDKVKGLGQFMEVEIMDYNRKEGLNRIYGFYNKIGISKEDLIPEKRYLDMIWGKQLKKNKKIRIE